MREEWDSISLAFALTRPHISASSCVSPVLFSHQARGLYVAFARAPLAFLSRLRLWRRLRPPIDELLGREQQLVKFEHGGAGWVCGTTWWLRFGYLGHFSLRIFS